MNQNTRYDGSTQTEPMTTNRQPVYQNQTDTGMNQNTRYDGSTQTEPMTTDRQPVYQNQTNRDMSQVVPNYVGIGGSNRGAALESKFAFNNHFSIRPMAVDNLESSGQQGDFSLPVTYDFNPVLGKLQPYVGGGLGVTAGDNSSVGGMLTAGADYPINKSLTANASVNYDAFGNNDVNGVLGVAANFN